MATNLLEAIPEDILFSCFNFLTPSSLTKLDSAFCNEVLRYQLLSLFASKHYVLENVHHEQKFYDPFAWLFRRQISFNELILYGSQFVKIAPELMTFHWNDNQMNLKVLQDKDKSQLKNGLFERDMSSKVMADFINKHPNLTSIEIRSDGFDPHEVFKLVNSHLISKITVLRLPVRSKRFGFTWIRLLSEHCSNLLVLEIDCLSRIELTIDLQTLLLKNSRLVVLSLRMIIFRATLVDILSNFLKFLKCLTFTRMFFSGPENLEESFEKLVNVGIKLNYLKIILSEFLPPTIRFCVDKVDGQHHKLYIEDRSNSSPLWLHSFSSSSVKTLTLFRAENLSTAFLDAISVRLPALEVLTFEDMRAFSSELPKMVSECAGLTTINIANCAGISVDNLLELISANKDVVNFTIAQDSLTVAGFQTLLDGCCSRCPKLKSVACFSDELSTRFKRDDELLNRHFKYSNLLLSFYKSEDEEEWL
jgi:hypothetical protein